MGFFTRLFGWGKPQQELPQLEVPQEPDKAASQAKQWPVEEVMDFVKRNLEKEGYADALDNPEVSNRESKEQMLRHNITLKFMSAKLQYACWINGLEVKIKHARDVLAFMQVDQLQTILDNINLHVDQLKQMENDFNAGAPYMNITIDTYRRGFNRGVVASNQAFLGTVELPTTSIQLDNEHVA